MSEGMIRMLVIILLPCSRRGGQAVLEHLGLSLDQLDSIVLH